LHSRQELRNEFVIKDKKMKATAFASAHRNNDTFSILKRWWPLPLRLIVGYGFMAHGYAKLVRGPAHFAEVLHALSVPLPGLMAWATVLVELIGGLCVLLGAFVPLMSAPMAAILLVAILKVHLPYGFSSIKLQAVTANGPVFGQPGYEVGLLYLAMLASLVLGGSGPLALENLIEERRG
jgi:putative oxidoreductase